MIHSISLSSVIGPSSLDPTSHVGPQTPNDAWQLLKNWIRFAQQTLQHLCLYFDPFLTQLRKQLADLSWPKADLQTAQSSRDLSAEDTRLQLLAEIECNRAELVKHEEKLRQLGAKLNSTKGFFELLKISSESLEELKWIDKYKNELKRLDLELSNVRSAKGQPDLEELWERTSRSFTPIVDPDGSSRPSTVDFKHLYERQIAALYERIQQLSREKNTTENLSRLGTIQVELLQLQKEIAEVQVRLARTNMALTNMRPDNDLPTLEELAKSAA